MDRHVIANMGAELGATTTVFPSDEETRRFLQREGRAADWRPLTADAGCSYDEEDEIDLSELSHWSPRRLVPATSSKSARSQAKMSIRLISGHRPTPVGATLQSLRKSFAARRYRPMCRSTSILPRGSFWRR